MKNKDYINFCKCSIAASINELDRELYGIPEVSPDDVYMVEYCRVSQKYAAILATPYINGLCYKMTYDGDSGDLRCKIHKIKRGECYEKIIY